MSNLAFFFLAAVLVRMLHVKINAFFFLIGNITAYPEAGMLNFLWGAGDFAQIWSACGQHEIRYTK